MEIFILSWAEKCERWGGNIHIEGYFSSHEKAEQRATSLKLSLSDATPWVKQFDTWYASRHGTPYVMWIDKIIVDS